jgi:excisionase family DNA binding protein
MKPVATIPLSERPTVTVDEFCKMIGFGRSTFYKAVEAGEIKIRKFGKRTFVTQDEVKRVVQNMPRGTPLPKPPARKPSMDKHDHAPAVTLPKTPEVQS